MRSPIYNPETLPVKTLLILRHAKSSWRHASLPDHDRGLNKRGKRDAPRIGALILDRGLVPSLIVSSSANRAVTTAEIVGETCGYEHEIIIAKDLYSGGMQAYRAILRRTPDHHGSVLVVGHNPDMEELVEVLTEGYRRMPTAALAQLSLPIDSWTEFGLTSTCNLVNLWLPRELQS